MNDFFYKLEKKYHFHITKEPARLSGGFTHNMYALRTTKGDYAIKLLNPYTIVQKSKMRYYKKRRGRGS